MAKPKSEGFPYCQQDTDTFKDPKIRMLISKFGCDGYAVWDYIKQAAYGENGYYVEWNEDRQEVTAADLYISAEKTGLIVAYLLKRSLLVSKSFNGITVLTSHGIQKRFQEMAKAAKRDFYQFKPEVWILSEEETLRSVFCTKNQDNSGIKGVNSGIKYYNSGIIQQSKEKESKEKESKGKECDARTREDTPLEQFLNRWGINSNAIGNYSGGKLAGIDWEKVSERVEVSSFLKKQKAIGFYIEHYADILDGKYDDFGKSSDREKKKDPDFDGSRFANIVYE